MIDNILLYADKTQSMCIKNQYISEAIKYNCVDINDYIALLKEWLMRAEDIIYKKQLQYELIKNEFEEFQKEAENLKSDYQKLSEEHEKKSIQYDMLNAKYNILESAFKTKKLILDQREKNEVIK